MTFSLLHLFFIFVYVGTFTIGGGLVAINLMQESLVDSKVITSEEFFNMVAVSESTPGPIGINMATYVGFSQYGILGALITTAGEVLPSIVCIIFISHLFTKFHDNRFVKAAFSTLRPATTGVIAVATVKVFSVALLNKAFLNNFLHSFPHIDFHSIASLFSVPYLAFYAVGVILLFHTKIHPIILIALAALLAIFI